MQRINIFDFDSLLAPDTWAKMWVWVKNFGFNGILRKDALDEAVAEYRTRYGGDNVEILFSFLGDLLIENDMTITEQELMDGERYLSYYQGVDGCFGNAAIKNYIVSGGLENFLRKLTIAESFAGIYGACAEENDWGEIVQIQDKMTEERRIATIREILRTNTREGDCAEVLYVGDGLRDIEAMRYIHNHGGKTIFVHPDDTGYEVDAARNAELYKRLSDEGIVDYNLVADYRPGTELRTMMDEE